MSRPRNTDKLSNGSKTEPSVWVRAITANSEWPDKVNITLLRFGNFGAASVLGCYSIYENEIEHFLMIKIKTIATFAMDCNLKNMKCLKLSKVSCCKYGRIRLKLLNSFYYSFYCTTNKPL